MTETEWLACPRVPAMLWFLGPRASSRKLRLFAVACVRAQLALPSDNDLLNIIDTYERYADGLEETPEFLGTTDAVRWHMNRLRPALQEAANKGWKKLRPRERAALARSVVLECLLGVSSEELSIQHFWARPDDSMMEISYETPTTVLADRVFETAVDLLRDVFGHVFHTTPLDPGWLSPHILALARTADTEGRTPLGQLDPERLAVLADALADADCTDARLLDHLRSPGPHVHGCWALDEIVGRRPIDSVQ